MYLNMQRFSWKNKLQSNCIIWFHFCPKIIINSKCWQMYKKLYGGNIHQNINSDCPWRWYNGALWSICWFLRTVSQSPCADLSTYVMICNRYCFIYFKVVLLNAKGVMPVVLEFLVATTETSLGWLQQNGDLLEGRWLTRLREAGGLAVGPIRPECHPGSYTLLAAVAGALLLGTPPFPSESWEWEVDGPNPGTVYQRGRWGRLPLPASQWEQGCPPKCKGRGLGL